MATIVVFASSIFVASALVSAKAVELKCGKRNIILELISRLDAKSDKFVSYLRFKSLQLIQSIRYIFLVHSKIVLKNLFFEAEEKLIKEYKSIRDSVMGRKEIVGNGSASFYLKKITENKGSMVKGKIQETL
jgi:hypothetical protein